MEDKKITLDFANSNDSIELSNGISFINNPRLSEYFKQQKNDDEFLPLTYRESFEIDSSNLIKININIETVGYFLINFKNNDYNNEICLEIIDKVKKLKDDNLEFDKQCAKIKNILDILKNYDVLFASFILKASVSPEFIDFKDYKINFPFLFINDLPKENREKSIREKKTFFDIEAPFFNTDYLFNLLFTLFASFSIHVAVSLFCDNNWKGTLFLILFLGIICILNYCLFLIFYEKNAKHLSGHKLIMGLYLSLGSAIGLIVGILISQYYLEIKYSLLLVFIDILSFVICISSIFASKIIKLFKK